MRRIADDRDVGYVDGEFGRWRSKMSAAASSKSKEAHLSADSRAARVFILEDWPFYWLTRTFGKYQSRLEYSLKAISLDVPRWRVLMLLDESSSRSVSYLATEAISKLSTMTRIIQRMEKDGLVKTRSSSVDARVTVVKLTAKGSRARERAWAEADEVYSQAFKNISPQKAKRLIALLVQMHDNLNDA